MAQNVVPGCHGQSQTGHSSKAYRMELKVSFGSELSTPVRHLGSLSILWEMALEKGASDILSNKIITEAGIWPKSSNTPTQRRET